MTEQWQELKETITELRDNDGTATQQEVCKFLVNYMDVLEKQMQESCKDAISRAEALRHSFQIYDDGVGYKVIFADKIEQLPPVKPQEKTGRWIKSCDCYGNKHFTCPFCEHDIATKADTLGDNYCSNCGAKMQTESEASNDT